MIINTDDTSVFDTTPTSGSNNAVTSDGIVKYVDKIITERVDSIKDHKIIFTESGIFKPSSYNLEVGDTLNVTCVGGGGGGGGTKSTNSTSSTHDPVVTNAPGTYGSGYGGGGDGAKASMSPYWEPGSNTGSKGDQYLSGGGGGGGCGAYSKKTITLTSVSDIAVTIGAKGTPGKPTSDPGAGGTSSFGSYTSAPGGPPGSNSIGNSVYYSFPIVRVSSNSDNGTEPSDVTTVPGASGAGNGTNGGTSKAYTARYQYSSSGSNSWNVVTYGEGGKGGNGFNPSTGEMISGAGGGNGVGSGIVIVEW